MTDTPDTDKMIEELEALERECTRSPWEPVRSVTCGHLRAAHNYNKDARQEWTDADIAFLKAARNYMPHLLAALKEQRAVIEGYAASFDTQHEEIERLTTIVAEQAAKATPPTNPANSSTKLVDAAKGGGDE